MKHELHKTLSRRLIQGRNPIELARELRKTRDVSVYDAERLLRTEMSRVCMDAKLRSIVDNGFTEFIFIAEPGSSRTCDVCKSLDKSIFKVSDGQVGINIPPIHPNCRCSIAGHVSDDALEEYFKEIGIELTDRDRKLLGLSRKDASGKNKSSDMREYKSSSSTKAKTHKKELEPGGTNDNNQTSSNYPNKSDTKNGKIEEREDTVFCQSEKQETKI